MRKVFIGLILSIISFNSLGQSLNSAPYRIEHLYPQQVNVSPYHNTWAQKHYAKRIQEFINQPLEFGDIVYIGNSITEGGKDWSTRFDISHIRNRGIAGDLSDGVLRRLDEIIYFKPKAVFILIGINDLFNLHQLKDNPDLIYSKTIPSAHYVAKNILKITRLINQRSPATKIYVRTLLPTRRDFLKEDILAVNKSIFQNAKRGKYQVVDIYKQFVDSNGDLMEDYTHDGVHLNNDGYQKWVDFEKSLLLKL